MGVTLYTLGHSNRRLADCLDILRAAGVRVLVDIRSRPASRRQPQFNGPLLRAACEQEGLVYHWAGRQLGGRRPARPGSPHRGLPEGLRGFADYMDGPAFQRAAAQLRRLASDAPTALLCAERDPGACHRGLIADYLLLEAVEVRHLIDTGLSIPHRLHPAARRESARLVYDAAPVAGPGG